MPTFGKTVLSTLLTSPYNIYYSPTVTVHSCSIVISVFNLSSEGKKTDKQTNKYRETSKQADRQTDRQTDVILSLSHKERMMRERGEEDKEREKMRKG